MIQVSESIRSRSAVAGTTIAIYGAGLLAAVFFIPLRIPEILQIVPMIHFSGSRLIQWIAAAPDSAPLNYLVQLPFVFAGGASRLFVRLPSFVFALGSCYLFWHLAKPFSQRAGYGLLLFMLLPAHFMFATQARPFEQALFLSILALLCFVHLIERPTVVMSLVYGLCLTACLYTEPYSYLPAVGWFSGVFRFVNRAQQRRALWYALPPTVAPVLLFLPYYVWAHPQRNPDWLSLVSSQSSDLPQWVVWALLPLLLAGLVGGLWASFRPLAVPIAKRVGLFCIFGGVISTLFSAVVIGGFTSGSFSTSQALWITPALAILCAVALDRTSPGKQSRLTSMTAAVATLGLCLVADFTYVMSQREDLPKLATEIAPRLTADSCVVFVSQKLSRTLFLVFAPQLRERECADFFPERVVLASHPYVSFEQQHNAESYFKGLTFSEISRTHIGKGQIIVLQQAK